jgi:pimeloyl-ACP methyl ester carboxylesterase
MSRFLFILFAVLASLGAGCALRRPQNSVLDLARISGLQRPPVIILHGILGSFLADRVDGDIEWLRAGQAFFVEPRPSLAFEITPEAAADPRLVRDRHFPVSIVDRVNVIPFLYHAQVYEPLIDAFRQAGYRVGDCDFPRADEDAFVFHYDFRRDAVESACQLARAVERVLDTRTDRNQKVSIVAHSFGGLIARYYLMYGGRDVLGETRPRPTGEGASRVESMVFLGTPHHGSMSLFQVLLRGYGIFYSGQLLTSEEIRTMPSAYQILPCPGLDVFVDATGDGDALDTFREPAAPEAGSRIFNLYDPNNWPRVGILPESWRSGLRHTFFVNALKRGERWWWALEQPWRPPAGFRALAVGGTQTPTQNRAFFISRKGGGLDLAFDLPRVRSLSKIRRFEAQIDSPGDGRVTIQSALDVPYAQRLASTALHDAVHQDPAVLDNVILFLFGEQFMPYSNENRPVGRP